jgi:hypothetical protein
MNMNCTQCTVEKDRRWKAALPRDQLVEREQSNCVVVKVHVEAACSQQYFFLVIATSLVRLV